MPRGEVLLMQPRSLSALRAQQIVFSALVSPVATSSWSAAPM